jgi:hypothetical protein
MNYIAQFYGIFLTVMSLGLILNKKNYENIVNDLKNHPSMQMIMALLPLLLGAFLVIQYPMPTGDIEHKLVVIVGWLLLLSGLIRTLVPAIAQKMLDKCTGKCAALMVPAVIMLLLGLGLLYFGFDMHQLLK